MCRCRFHPRERLRKADPDFAARRPRRTQRGLHAHRLAYGERVCLRVDGVTALRPDHEPVAALGSRCSTQYACCRERDSRRKRPRLQSPRRLHVRAAGRVQGHDLLRSERVGIRLADGGGLDGRVDDRESGIDEDAEPDFGSILALAPVRPAFRLGQVVIPDPKARESGARGDTEITPARDIVSPAGRVLLATSYQTYGFPGEVQPEPSSDSISTSFSWPTYAVGQRSN